MATHKTAGGYFKHADMQAKKVIPKTTVDFTKT